MAGAQMAAAVYLTCNIGLSLYRSHQALSPSQDTRQRTERRRKLTAGFGALALVSLAAAVTSGLSYRTLSYQVWASERGLPIPNSSVLSSLLEVRHVGHFSLTPYQTLTMEVISQLEFARHKRNDRLAPQKLVERHASPVRCP